MSDKQENNYEHIKVRDNGRQTVVEAETLSREVIDELGSFLLEGVIRGEFESLNNPKADFQSFRSGFLCAHERAEKLLDKLEDKREELSKLLYPEHYGIKDRIVRLKEAEFNEMVSELLRLREKIAFFKKNL